MQHARIPCLGLEHRPLNGLSQVKGRTDAALSNAPIHRFLLEAVQRFADRPAVVFREQGRWTWAQLQAEVDALAAGFIALGLRVGDRVGIWSPNRAEWLVTQFATARAGLVLVNINPAYRIAELEYALNLSGCRAWSRPSSSRPRNTWRCCSAWRPSWSAARPVHSRPRACRHWRW